MAKKNKNTLELVGGVTLIPEGRSRYVTIVVDGKKARVHYKELWGAVFVLGDGKYREQMIPARKEERMVFSRKHEIEVKRDVKAGEKLAVWCEVDVAKTVVAAIAEKEGAKVVDTADFSTPPQNRAVGAGL